MRLMTFRLKPIALIMIFCVLFSINVNAEENVPETEPDIEEYLNVSNIYSQFEIQNGTAFMTARFFPFSSMCSVDVEMLIEYQLSPQLYLPIKSYSDSVSGSATSVQHELQLSFTGTYRLTVTVTVSGPFGPDDAYQNTHTDYN